MSSKEIVVIIGLVLAIVGVLYIVIVDVRDWYKEKENVVYDSDDAVVEAVLMFLEDKQSELESELEKWHSGDYVWISSENRQMSDNEIRVRKDSIQVELTKVKRLFKALLEIQKGY